MKITWHALEPSEHDRADVEAIPLPQRIFGFTDDHRLFVSPVFACGKMGGAASPAEVLLNAILHGATMCKCRAGGDEVYVDAYWLARVYPGLDPVIAALARREHFPIFPPGEN